MRPSLERPADSEPATKIAQPASRRARNDPNRERCDQYLLESPYADLGTTVAEIKLQINGKEVSDWLTCERSPLTPRGLCGRPHKFRGMPLSLRSLASPASS